jgi:hypothetical protein
MSRLPVPPKSVLAVMISLLVVALLLALRTPPAQPTAPLEPTPLPLQIAAATPAPLPTSRPAPPLQSPRIQMERVVIAPPSTSVPLPVVPFSPEGIPAADGTTLRSEAEASYYSQSLAWRKMIEGAAINYKSKPTRENAVQLVANINAVGGQMMNVFNVPSRFSRSDLLLNDGIGQLNVELREGTNDAVENIRLGRSKGYFLVYKSWNEAAAAAKLSD